MITPVPKEKYVIELNRPYKYNESANMAFIDMYEHYIPRLGGGSWKQLERILNEEYNAHVSIGKDWWDYVYFDSEEDLVAFKLKWL